MRSWVRTPQLTTHATNTLFSFCLTLYYVHIYISHASLFFFLNQYACRKSLADSRPRIRGRFARTDEPEEEPTVSCGKKHAASGHITLAEDCRNSCTSQHTGPSGFLSVSD